MYLRPFHWLLDHPRWTLLGLLIAFVTAFTTLWNFPAGQAALEVDPSIRGLLPRHGPELDLFETVRERYDSDDVLLVAWTGPELFTPQGLRGFKALAREVERLAGVERVESLATALHIVADEDVTDVGAYLARLPDSSAEAQLIAQAARADPLNAGYLIARQGDGAVIAVHFSAALSAQDLIPVVQQIEALSATRSPAGVDSFLSGPLYARLEISRLLLVDLFRGMPLAMLVTLLIAAGAFRHLHGVLLPLSANTLAVAGTLALFIATGHTLNYVTVILPPTIYVVGFAYAMHVVAEFDRQPHDAASPDARLRRTLDETWAPITLTAWTTALGFAALMTSAIDSIRVFGLFASTGTLLAWFSALTVVPLGLRRVPGKQDTSASVARRRGAVALSRLAVEHSRALLVAASALSLLAAAGASQVRVGTDYLENFAEESALRRNFAQLGEMFSGAVPLQILIEADRENAFHEPDNLTAVRDLEVWLMQQPEVGGVYSLVDYLGELEKALAPDLVDADPVPPSAGVARHLLLLGGSEDARRFADADYRSTLLQVRLHVIESAALNALVARIETRLQTLPADLRGAVTGSSCLISRTIDAVTRGQLTSLLLAFLPISLVVLGVFRSVRIALLVMIPNVLPILAFFGLLGLSGMTLNLTTSLVAAAVLGIAVDDSIHFFLRLRREVARGLKGQAAIAEALDGVIRPVTLSTLGLAAGFATLLSGELIAQGEFGMLAAATLVIAWILDLSVSPALAWVGGIAGQVGDTAPRARR